MRPNKLMISYPPSEKMTTRMIKTHYGGLRDSEVFERWKSHGSQALCHKTLSVLLPVSCQQLKLSDGEHRAKSKNLG